MLLFYNMLFYVQYFSWKILEWTCVALMYNILDYNV